MAYAARIYLCCFVSFCLNAQVQNKHQDWMTWDDSRVVTIGYSESKILRIESPVALGSSAIQLKAPENSLVMEFKDHAAWATAKGSTKNPQNAYLYRSIDLKTWDVNATYQGGNGRCVAIHHLDGKRYFLVSGPGCFYLGNKFSPYATAETNDKGILSITELVDLGLKEPLAIQSRPLAGDPGPKCEFNPKYTALLAMLLGNPMLRYPGGLVLVARRPGYLWVFDDRSGALKRNIKLFSGVTEEKLGPPNRLDWAILACQPRPNGHLLIASRDEAAVLTGMDAYPTKKSLQYLDDEVQQKANVEQDQLSLNRWPSIHWWDVDPATGTITEEQPPQNVPDRIWDLRMFHNFTFRFKPDGNLWVN